MNYLENVICNFEIISNWNKSIKYNILSTCFFKMNSHYKNFLIYINGLKKLIKMIENQNNYYLRIFIDEHVKSDSNIFNILIKSKKVQIVLFKCSKYLDNNFHIDVFGALVRLFPLFDFDNNDALNVIITDIDLNNEDLNKLKIVMNYKTNIKEIIGMGMIDKLLITKYRPHFFCAVFAVFNKKFNKSIITDFIKNASNIIDTGFYRKRLKAFGYGTDELFINDYFLYKNSSILVS